MRRAMTSAWLRWPIRIIASGTSNKLVDEAVRAALGVRRSFPESTVQDLTRPGDCREQRVVTEGVGVAEPGALLGLAGHLTDR